MICALHGGNYLYIMASSITLISLRVSKLLQNGRIEVGEEEAGTSAFNQVYDKFQVNE